MKVYRVMWSQLNTKDLQRFYGDKIIGWKQQRAELHPIEESILKMEDSVAE